MGLSVMIKNPGNFRRVEYVRIWNLPCHCGSCRCPCLTIDDVAMIMNGIIGMAALVGLHLPFAVVYTYTIIYTLPLRTQTHPWQPNIRRVDQFQQTLSFGRPPPCLVGIGDPDNNQKQIRG
jgi:hypothetical protein